MSKVVFDESDVALIRKEFSAEQALNYCGVQVYPRGRVYCINPNHADKRLGNCSINPKNGTLHCFACGETWNGLDVLITVLGCDFRTALETAARIVGVQGRILDPSPNKGPWMRKLTREEATLIGMPSGRVPVIYGQTRDPDEARELRAKGYKVEVCALSEDVDEFTIYEMVDDPSLYLYRKDPCTYAYIICNLCTKKIKNVLLPAMDDAFDSQDMEFHAMLWELARTIAKIDEYYRPYAKKAETG